MNPSPDSPGPLPQPRRESLVEQVIEQFRSRITQGDWPVGLRIPTEQALVDQLGVARNTVREAVRALANNGLLDIRQGSGTYVIATSELAGVMQRRFAQDSTADVTELLRELAASGARLAAQRRTGADLERLGVLLEQRDRAWEEGDLEHYLEADAQFHRAVVAASHNASLISLYADLDEVWRGILRRRIGAMRPGTRRPHEGIVEAIRDHDGAAADLHARGDLMGDS
ncbi:FadR family transcriptional regulator [Arthrobacter sp. Sa2CUA1]|uniref:FadR family transcriptional regulator n=1 Tax=Arthrobacter gallicola TaxID=2762225 RepID=A0ABR8UTN9_9MICC|nr:FCD domain-containing protein [Arthrobacter gallicola]MBD7995937.1 FadR family transcriptional regulator [Arthrobacter gallicola]